jgi:hypothetical protein
MPKVAMKVSVSQERSFNAIPAFDQMVISRFSILGLSM